MKNGTNTPQLHGPDPRDLEPMEARIVVRENLYRLCELSADTGHPCRLDQQDLWYLWRLAHQASIEEPYDAPPGMGLVICIVVAIAFGTGIVFGVVLG